MQKLQYLIELLGITEDEAIRALLSAFASVQPGPTRQGWMRNRSNPAEAPTTRAIWEIYVAAGFRCSLCGTHYDITIDHKDRNPINNDISNLRVLCRDCNRSVNSRGLVNKHSNLRIYKATQALIEQHGCFPTPQEIVRAAGLTQLSGSHYMVKFFKAKYEEQQLKKKAGNSNDTNAA